MTAPRRRSRALISGPGHDQVLTALSRPDATSDTALLRVQASGVCGTDVALLRAGLEASVVLGHHVVGIVEEAGDAFLAHRGLALGDQVVIEEYLPCGACPACQGQGTYRFCPDTDLFRGGRRIGLTPVDQGFGLLGGNAEHLALPPNAVVHRVPVPLPPDQIVWTLPLANALDWTSGTSTLDTDSVVLIIGPGQHGLAAISAARLAGATNIIVAGTSCDRTRLDTAAALGATTTIDVDAEDLSATVREATQGRQSDMTVATAGPLASALDATGRSGTVVLAGGGHGTVDPKRLIRDALTVRGARGRHPKWIHAAISHLVRGDTRLEGVPTEMVSLDHAGATLDAMANGHGPQAAHVVIRP